MSIIDTVVSALRSLTGGSTERSTEPADTDSREGQVSVEHDPDTESVAADTSTEAAVKGTDPGDGTVDDGTVDAGSDDEATDAAAAGTDAAASTGTLVDEDAGGEPAETVGQGGGVDAGGTVDEVEAGPETEEAGEDTETDEVGSAGADAGDPADGDGDAGEPVETVKGIGPAYADRLETVGIETVGELAAADAAEVADGIDVSESRVGDWVERARDAP